MFTMVLVVALIAVITQLATFFLRLGYVLPLAWGSGLVLSVLVTVPLWKKQRRLTGLVGVTYVLSILLSYVLFFNHRRIEVQPMTWVNKGIDNQWKQPEVVLEFVNHPGQRIGIYSTDVAEYLAKAGTNPVNVSFDVISDLGCIRGFNPTLIGELEKWRSASGYSGSNGTASFPWKSAPWCHGV